MARILQTPLPCAVLAALSLMTTHAFAQTSSPIIVSAYLKESTTTTSQIIANTNLVATRALNPPQALLATSVSSMPLLMGLKPSVYTPGSLQEKVQRWVYFTFPSGTTASAAIAQVLTDTRLTSAELVPLMEFSAVTLNDTLY
jgi:hypothetical protein